MFNSKKHAKKERSTDTQSMRKETNELLFLYLSLPAQWVSLFLLQFCTTTKQHTLAETNWNL